MVVLSDSGRSATAHLAKIYSGYLRQPSTATATSLCTALVATRQPDLAGMVRAFADNGDHLGVTPSPWWQAGEPCWVGFSPPAAQRAGQLWFDPLELTCFVLGPRPRDPELDSANRADGPPGFLSWVALWPVTGWRLRAAHELTGHLAPRAKSGPIAWNPTQVRGVDVRWYGWLFNRRPTNELDWLGIKAAYGESAVRQLWGQAHEQFGGHASISGFMQTLTLDDVLAWDWFDEDIEPPEVDEFDVLGLPFRTSVSADRPLPTTFTIPRVWNRGTTLIITPDTPA